MRLPGDAAGLSCGYGYRGGRMADGVRSGEVERSGGCKSLWSGGKLPEFRTKELDGKV